ncbi:MAG: hypothetical protein IJU44_10275 [Kiritimatiellae bacterium]|nr:hypothetical protein [Kiritimatiellia bacterium]
MGSRLKNGDELKEQVINILSSPDVVSEIRKIVLGILKDVPPHHPVPDSGNACNQRLITVCLEETSVTLSSGNAKPLSISDGAQCLMAVLALNGFGAQLEPRYWQERMNQIFANGKSSKYRWLTSTVGIKNISEKMRQVRDRIEPWLSEIAGTQCRIIPVCRKSGYAKADWDDHFQVQWMFSGQITKDFPYGEFPDRVAKKLKPIV